MRKGTKIKTVAFGVCLVLAAGSATFLAKKNAMSEQAMTSSRGIESRMPPFHGVTGWLNSPPLSGADLRGKVVVVSFWTFSCVNWLRTEPYIQAWADKYRDHGLMVIGVHTPEFSFERSLENVRWATGRYRIPQPRGARQRLCGLALVQQQLLAGALFHRRWRACSRTSLRRGRLRTVGGDNPGAAQGGRARRFRSGAGFSRGRRAGSCRRLVGGSVSGELCRRGEGRKLRLTWRHGRRRAQRIRDSGAAASQSLGSRGALAGGRRGNRARQGRPAGSPTAFTRATRIW